MYFDTEKLQNRRRRADLSAMSIRHVLMPPIAGYNVLVEVKPSHMKALRRVSDNASERVNNVPISEE